MAVIRLFRADPRPTEVSHIERRLDMIDKRLDEAQRRILRERQQYRQRLADHR